MPPKKDQSVNNTSSSSNINTTETTTNTTSAVTSATAITTQSTTATTTATSAANTTTPILTTNIQPVIIPDMAAEQRTIAYQANAKLCRLVRKCPWMYDRNHHNYAKKHILDKSWCKIARECNDSVASCKERWRNIRAAFARSINIYKTHSGPNRVKPYYLHKELSFLVKPMMEGRDKKDEFDDTQETVKDEEGSGGGGGGGDEVEEEAEEEEPVEEEEEDFPDDTAEIKSAFEALNPDIRIHTETKYQKMLRNSNVNLNNNNDFESSGIFEPHTEFTTSDAENEFTFPDDTLSQAEAERRVAHMINNHNNSNNGLKRPPMHLETETLDTKRFKLTHNSATATENDIRFLEALLPDMALMNTRQKIVFKRKIYQTLEEVFENSHDFPNIEHNTTTTKMEPNTTPSITNTTQNSNTHHHHTNNVSTNNSFTTNTITGGGGGGGGAQVRQTVLTVNSSTARTLINNIANLNETELQKVNGFLQNSLRNPTPAPRLLNGSTTPSSAAAKLMSATPKITITKVSCPPPASLRHLTLTKPPSPSPATVSTTIHNPASSIISSNVHSTTSNNPTNSNNSHNKTSSTTGSISIWNQLLPITIKDEIEDVDID